MRAAVAQGGSQSSDQMAELLSAAMSNEDFMSNLGATGAPRHHCSIPTPISVTVYRTRLRRSCGGLWLPGEAAAVVRISR